MYAVKRCGTDKCARKINRRKRLNICWQQSVITQAGTADHSSSACRLDYRPGNRNHSLHDRTILWTGNDYPHWTKVQTHRVILMLHRPALNDVPRATKANKHAMKSSDYYYRPILRIENYRSHNSPNFRRSSNPIEF